MRRYPSYLSWDVDQELRLHNTVSKVDMLSAWLQSLGVRAPHRIVISHPVILSLKLKTLQVK